MLLKSILTVWLVGTLACITTTSVHAAETVRIFTGGPGAAKYLNNKKAEIEAAVGANVEIRSAPATASIKFLSKGTIQGLVMGTTPEIAFKEADASDIEGDSAQNYDWFEFYKVYIKIGLNPENARAEPKAEQIHDLLAGKVKNWKEIGGIDAPVKIFFLKASSGTINQVSSHYLKGEEMKNAEYLLDRDGLLRALQRNKGGLIFSPTGDNLGDFKPRYLNSEVSHSTYYVAKKGGSPMARKLFDYIKAMPHTDAP